MKGYVYIFVGLSTLLLVSSCGKPRLDALVPNSGPPHTIVEITGDDVFSTIWWDAGTATPDALPGAWLGGGPFSVPPGASLGNHQVQLERDGEFSDDILPFNVTAPVVTFPNPSLTHLSSIFSETIPGTPDRAAFYLFVQGPNIDIGARIVVNGVEYDSVLWKVYQYDSNGRNPANLNYPIFHYTMVMTLLEEDVGANLNVQVKNLDNNLSNTLVYTVAAEADWDSDGDGLLDDWEDNGYDGNGDGTIDTDLPAMGADKFLYDVFVETDFMDGETTADPDKQPVNTTWPIVEQSYANSPLINLYGGLQGIQLHVDRGQSTFTDLRGDTFTIPVSERKGGQILPFSDFIRMDGNNASFAAPGETTVNFYDLKSTNFDNASRREIFHYGIFANAHGHSNGATGRGEIFGNDFFVTLRDIRLTAANISAGTYLHELGHNLGLDHGGDDSVNNEPNHYSIMSYFSSDGSFVNSYQAGGVDNNCDTTVDGIYDYSHGMLNDLNETALNENNGICDGVAIDWNGMSGIQSSVSFDIDGSSATLLDDHNNWGRDFRFNFRNATSYND